MVFDAEVDRRHAGVGKRVEDAPGVGQGVLAVVGARELADPRVEHLDRLSAGLDLREQVVRHHRGEAIAERMPRRGLREHEGLRPRVAGGRPAFDRIRRHGEGRAPEADERHFVLELRSEQPNRLEDVRKPFPRIDDADPFDVGGRSNRVFDRRPFTLDEFEGQPHRREGKQQIGEQDRRVDVDDVYGLKRDRDGQLRLRADLKQGIALPQRAIVGHVPAGLAHEPDRRDVNGLAAAGAEKTVVHCATRVLASAIRSSSQRGLKRMEAPEGLEFVLDGIGEKVVAGDDRDGGFEQMRSRRGPFAKTAIRW